MAETKLEFALDLDSFTLGDLDDFETYAGVTFESLTDMKTGVLPPIRVVAVLAWIVGRRSEPTLTLEQLKSWPISQALGVLGATLPSEAGSDSNTSDNSGPSSISTEG